MKKYLLNQEGAMVPMIIIIVVIFISLLTTVSLLAIINTDLVNLNTSQDLIQEELLLRSENERTKISLSYNSSIPISSRKVEIIEPNRESTYSIVVTTKDELVETFLGQAMEKKVSVVSTATCKRGRSNDYVEDNEPAVRESYRLMGYEGLEQYQYFTDSDQSPNEDGGEAAARVKFYGNDVLYGKVHSNTDIYLQNNGEGDNSGWPTFWSAVSTAEIFRDNNGNPANGNIPLDEIMKDTWTENAPPILFSADASAIRRNGARPFPDDTDIVQAHLDGMAAETYCGQIVSTGVKNFIVYSWVPDRAELVDIVIANNANWLKDVDSIWTNQIVIYDTTWSQGATVTVSNNSVFADCELWIHGEVEGNQCWGAAGNVYLSGDITYANTEPGEAPDDEDNLNTTDMFGLVSEQSIYIQYKQFDPFQVEENEDYHPEFPDPSVPPLSTKKAPNCASILIYGAYAAIGEGDAEIYGDFACHYDGIFTFQYQHPHGSTPHFRSVSPNTFDDTIYYYVDFHKYIFPTNITLPPDAGNLEGFILHSNGIAPGQQSCGFPFEANAYINSYPNPGPIYQYPYGTDWPWENPVWPESESDIVYERGVITMFGAIAQRRRGFVHRSGTDPYEHPGDAGAGGIGLAYELVGSDDEDKYNYGGTHGSTGYDKDYHYDKRFLSMRPADYPRVYRGWEGSEEESFDETTWYFRIPPKN
jgi:hypothetical protein